MGVDPGLGYIDSNGTRVVVTPTRIEIEDGTGLEFIKAGSAKLAANSNMVGRMVLNSKHYFKNQIIVGNWNNKVAFGEEICYAKYRFYQMLRILFRHL